MNAYSESLSYRRYWLNQKKCRIFLTQNSIFFHAPVRSLLLLASWFFASLTLFVPRVLANEINRNIYDFSLKELTELVLRTSTLTATSVADSPSSVTIITREQIERTAARNVLDLLESYVPGLSFYRSNTGGNIRIRGLGERNYKTILLLNGRPVNQKSHQGSVVELNNWDMTDIERLEVVRGPGSVTHGPGAISGVINIITRKAGSIDGLRTGLDYYHGYQSRGVYLDFGRVKDGFEYIVHASFRATDGFEDPDIFQLTGGGSAGYKGDPSVFSNHDGNPLAGLQQDYDGTPQVKFSVDMSFLEKWRFWARYVSAGHATALPKREFPDGLDVWRQFHDQHFIASLEHETTFSETVSINTILSFDSENFIQTKAAQSDLSNTADLNLEQNFSENEWFLRSILAVDLAEDNSVALGVEYSYDYVKAPWWESGRVFKIGTSSQIFISEDSVHRGDGKNGTIEDDDVIKFSDGWSADTLSLMGELKYALGAGITSFLSARLDKNKFTDPMFSPRIALQSELDDKSRLKLSWQRSLRMNTLHELYTEHLTHTDTEAEESTAMEIAYSRDHNEQLNFTLTSYYSDSEIIAWSRDRAELVGEQKLWGLEFEMIYRAGSFSIGLNHAYLDLIDWNFSLKEEDGSKRQRVSWSDYLETKDYLTLTSTGNELNFWVNNQTKLWSDIPIGQNMVLHIDSRILWGIEYGDALFKMYDRAYAAVDVDALSTEDLEDYNENLAHLANYNEIIDDKDTFGIDIRVNASLTWRVPSVDNLRLIIYGQNLINITENKRQNSQNTQILPVTSWVEEPRTIGFKAELFF